jgi:glycosyltransferase involved in cell wall biosynthesis
MTETLADVGDITAVVPVRNGAALLPACLSALDRSGVGAVVVVDGLSTDDSREIASAHGAKVLSDEGKGLPHARAIGAAAACTRLVLLVDCDVVFPDGALAALLDEFRTGGYAALQAGLSSVGGPGYWGRALAYHHRTGRSRRWFGLVATLFERDELVRIGFDDDFTSGEDIELRWRLRQAGRPAGVSERATVEHRFAGDDFAFALDQFLMDGTGLGRMVRKHGLRGVRLLALPLAAALRGSALSAARGQPRWIPYYAAFCWFNYVGIARGLVRRC